jgi:hypothetical protein
MVVGKTTRDPGIKVMFESRKGNKSITWHLFFPTSWNIAHDQRITISFKLCDDKSSLILWLNKIIPL